MASGLSSSATASEILRRQRNRSPPFRVRPPGAGRTIEESAPRETCPSQPAALDRSAKATGRVWLSGAFLAEPGGSSLVGRRRHDLRHASSRTCSAESRHCAGDRARMRRRPGRLALAQAEDWHRRRPPGRQPERWPAGLSNSPTSCAPARADGLRRRLWRMRPARRSIKGTPASVASRFAPRGMAQARRARLFGAVLAFAGRRTRATADGMHPAGQLLGEESEHPAADAPKRPSPVRAPRR